MTSFTRYSKWTALACLFLVLAACQVRQKLTATPGPPAVILPTAETTAHSTAAFSSTDALSACDLKLQASAMRPGSIPDWDSLGITTCYELFFDLTSGGPGYTGSATITFTHSGVAALNDLVLRLYPNAPLLFGGQLELTSAQVNQAELSPEVFLDDQTAVRLPLPQPLAPGETLRLELEFTGTLPTGFASDSIYGTYNFNSQGPVLMMANAYPLLAPLQDGAWRADPVLPEGDAVVSQVALYRITVRVPADWQVVSSGRQVVSTADGSNKLIQIAGGPLREFMLAASPAFVLEQRQWQDVQINHWGLSESEEAWAEALQVAADSMEIFNQTFGLYPYTELDIIAAPLNNASGVEYPGLILLGESLYPSQSSPRMLPYVTAHEIAHQWWYAVVGNDVLEHPWQDEALATYSAQLYEMEHNPDFYQGALSLYRERVADLESEQGEQPIDQSVADLIDMPRAYSTIAYLKGNLFFEALRDEIGAPAMNAGLQSYFQDYSYQIAQPSALLNSFETACQCELDALYTHWGVQP